MHYIKFFLVWTVLGYLAFGCGTTTSVTNNPCSTEQSPTGVTINCPGSAPVTVENGQMGATGAAGATGATGNQGAAGSPCSVTQTATGASISCGNGTSATINNGANVTPITVVQFCANKTVYPTTFSEVALCISGNLYAVYSTNDGFLSLIPPGAYSSDGVDSSCSFSVAADCKVTE